MTAMTPATMTSDQLHAALTRLSAERQTAGDLRRQVITRVCDAVLDEVLARRTTHG